MSSYNERVKVARLTSLDVDTWIVSTSDTCRGEPRLRRTRIRVSDIVNMIKNGNEDDIYLDYQYITKEAVNA